MVMEIIKKDVMDIRVNLKSNDEIIPRRILLTASDKDEVMGKLKEWLHIMRLKCSCSIKDYEVLHRIIPGEDPVIEPVSRKKRPVRNGQPAHKGR